MAKKKKKEKRSTKKVRSSIFLTSADAYDLLCGHGYTTLDKCPEVLACARKIANLISGMTIYLMANTKNGDKRLNNALSRQVDITPNKYMTRKTWMDAIIMNLLIHGAGNSVVRITTNENLLGDLIPVPPGAVTFHPEGYGYYMEINGIRHEPDDVLHFIHNPDPDFPWMGKGINFAVKSIAENLQQAAETEKGFMQSKWKPSIIVKVDGMVEEFASKSGRKKLLEEYIETNEAGEPWMIPAEQFSVDQIRPLSLSDLAINETVTIDKKAVASLMDVPAFILGVGEFDADEWNNFIANTIGPMAKMIAQELTKKLLLSPDWYFNFNVSSLYSYDLEKTANVYTTLFDHGICDGNEVRDKLSMSPRDGLDQLLILENYIPVSKAGDQKKLGGNDE